MQVKGISEAGLLSVLEPYFGPNPQTLTGVGDDCAVLQTSDSRFVISTDMMAAGYDWRDEWSSPYQVGERIAAQNLADIAAMGARPVSFLLSLAMPDTTEVEWVKELFAGIHKRCSKAGVAIVGGDLGSAPLVVLSATVTGDLEGRSPVERTGAKNGDLIALAGTQGRSYCGLDLCYGGYPHPTDWDRLPRATRELAAECVSIFKAARPPLEAGIQAADAGASSMMDLSDGLVKDLRRICLASGVKANLFVEELNFYRAPLEELAVFLGKDTLDWVLSGGEDHGMLATFPPTVQIPESFRVIGEIIENETFGKNAEDLVLLGGAPAPMRADWDHFRA
ncbi:thiamine-phosphate kinase [Actinomycetaceae bacterium TAE3-ERU4]|nr:thiamine-phosphate kinase [Actinomycetaceae bacterium TAE3-ERU4]